MEENIPCKLIIYLTIWLTRNKIFTIMNNTVKEESPNNQEVTKMERITREDSKCEGMIMCTKEMQLTKKQFVELIEKNFPDDFGNIVLITTVEGGMGVSQSITFAKIINR